MAGIIPLQSLKGLKSAAPTSDDSSLPPSPGQDQMGGGDDHEMFQPAENGPFLCGHCEYFTSPGQCSEEHMIAKYGDEGGFTTANGQVSAGACCDYYESVEGEGPNGAGVRQTQ